MAMRFQERLQGWSILVEGELAGSDVAQGARSLDRQLGLDGSHPRGVKSLQRFLIASSLVEPGGFAQECIERSPAQRRYFIGCQGRRPGPRSGFRHRAD
jgi:hypothetical protein